MGTFFQPHNYMTTSSLLNTTYSAKISLICVYFYNLNILVIDFGFAKRVPYTSVDSSTGETKVHAKTYTLCGTPGKPVCHKI